jgi:hypothetical protein
MAYGPNRFMQYRRAVYFVDQILRGADPAELPIQHAPIELSFNVATAEALETTIPPELLASADALLYTVPQPLLAEPT